jgi:Spy/CpxP family protein refolding chaperone
MKRAWFLAFALSMGLNAGLLYVSLVHRGDGQGSGGRPPAREEPGEAGQDRQPQPGQPPGDFESVIRSHLDKMTRDLQLDDQQRSAIAKVHQGLLPRIVAERRDIEGLRREVASRYAGPTIDEAAFRSLVQQISQRQARLDSLVTEAMLGEAACLTPDQRQRYVREMPWGGPMPAPERPGEKRTENPPRRDDGQPAQGPPRRDDGQPAQGPPRRDDGQPIQGPPRRDNGQPAQERPPRPPGDQSPNRRSGDSR